MFNLNIRTFRAANDHGQTQARIVLEESNGRSKEAMPTSALNHMTDCPILLRTFHGLSFVNKFAVLSVPKTNASFSKFRWPVKCYLATSTQLIALKRVHKFKGKESPLVKCLATGLAVFSAI